MSHHLGLTLIDSYGLGYLSHLYSDKVVIRLDSPEAVNFDESLRLTDVSHLSWTHERESARLTNKSQLDSLV